MSLDTCCVPCVACVIRCVACVRLETALTAGCQLREDVEWVALSRISPRVRVRVSVSIVYRVATGGYSWIWPSGLSADQTMRVLTGATASCCG